MYEFIPDNPETWKVYRAPHIDASVQEALTRIGGVNPFGKPNLRVVWGGTEPSDTTEKHTLKYHCGYTKQDVQGYQYRDENGEWRKTQFIEGLEDKLLIPCIVQEEVGMPRWIIEKWISPEALRKAKRFESRYAPGDVEPTLREFPREGIYMAYFVVETDDEKYRPVDEVVLNFIKRKWHYEQNVSFEKREKDRDEYHAQLAREKHQRNEEIWQAGAAGDLRLPLEERLRREEMAENQRKAKERAEEEAKKLRFHYANSDSSKNTTAA